MATLQDYLGITALRDAWPKWKANVIAINNQVIAHIAGTADKHAAQDITYTGDFVGKTEVKAALDQAKLEIGTIVVSASIDPEVAFARESTVKGETFDTLDARLEESEQDLVSYKAETATLVINAKYPPLPLIGVSGVGEFGSDDSYKLQALIDYCILNKRNLYLPNGLYILKAVRLEIKGDIKIYGESRSGTIIKTVKTDGNDVDGTGIDYTGALRIIPSLGIDISVVLEDFTLDGGSYVDKKIFNPYHKGILCSYVEGYRISTLNIFNITIKNFEGEGAHSPNSIVSYCEFQNCYFSNCGGSMGNISGNTKYINCKFLNGSNHSIEHSNEAYTGGLEVVNCGFYNGCKNVGSSISVQNHYDPFIEAEVKYDARRNTSLIIRNCRFEFTKEWIISTTESTVYYFGSVHFTEVGDTVIENNFFNNSGYGVPQGEGPILIREWNDCVIIKNNLFSMNDIFFNCYIIPQTSVNTLIIKNNGCVYEYPLVSSSIYPYAKGSLTAKRLVISGNSTALNPPQQFTNTISQYIGLWIPVLKKYTFKINISIVVSSLTFLDILDESSVLIKNVVNETLAIGEYVYYVDFISPYLASRFTTKILLKGNSDVSNSVVMELIEI